MPRVVWRPPVFICRLSGTPPQPRPKRRRMSRAMIVGAVALLVAAQAGWIVALLVSRARRRRTEARNNAILRALPDLMFVQTRDGVYVDYSAKDDALLFVPPSQFMGR